jgi:hypothetical protein
MMSEEEKATVAQILGMMRSLTQDFSNQAKLMIDVERKLDTLIAAFPEHGLEAHRIYHENQLTIDKDARVFRQSLRSGLALFGIPASLGFVGWAVWEAIKIKIHQ